MTRQVPRTKADPFLRAIPALLATFVLGFVAAHAMNVPYWDEWEFTEVIAGTEPFTWGWVWAPHNEHRLVWQKRPGSDGRGSPRRLLHSS